MGSRVAAVVDRPVAVVDVETTGLHLGYHHRVVEVAVLRFAPDGRPEGALETLIDPGRDIGASEVHGVTASQLVGAPTFAEVAGDIEGLLDGAILAAHNVMFDLRFLRSEFRLLGDPLPHLDLIDTMHLPRRIGLRTACHSLDAVAEFFDIVVDERHRHTARGDAEVCAALFWRLAELMRHDGTPLRQFCLPSGWDPPDGDCMPGHPPTGRRHTRQHAGGRHQRQFGYLARLAAEVDRLPVVTWDERCETYIALLDRCLEDHLITDEERDALRDLAHMIGMTGDDVRAAHRVFVDRIVAAAWADGVVTDSEVRDLRAVGHWLGIDPAGIDRLIASASADREQQVRPGVPSKSVWSGTTVCFTGTLPNRMTRAQAWEAAESAGCVPSKSITKKVDVLVVADPNTKSGKAKTAREYGIRIMAADRFFRELGIHKVQFAS